jgi:hypothetical protein
MNWRAHFRRLLRRQDGITLVMAVGILGVLSFSGATLIYYSNSNARSAKLSNDSTSAYDLAEAGINEMMAVLSKPENNALNKFLLGYQPDGSVVKTVHTYDAGTVEWSGTLDEISATWSLTSVGKIENPTNQIMDVKRTLTAKVPVTATVTQPLNNPSWNYIMSTQVTGGTCDMTLANNVEVRTNLYVFGNLCLQQQGKVLKGETSPTSLVVKGKVTQYTNQNTIGTNGNPLSEVHVAQGCTWFNNAFHNPCQPGTGASGKDELFATTFSSNPVTLAAPGANWEAWYLNASPGPYYPCTITNTGVPPTFDNDQGAQSNPDPSKRNNSVSSLFNMTGASSYSCKTATGELTWDASSKVLTVSGTIFIDGDLEARHSSQTVVQYNGQATLYLSGSLLIKNTKFCAGVVGANCDFNAWDPNTEMLTFVTNADSRQPEVGTGIGTKMINSQLQGALYATEKIDLDTSSKVDGPMVAKEIILGQSVSTSDFQTITTVPVGMPGSPTVYAQPNPPQLYSG